MFPAQFGDQENVSRQACLSPLDFFPAAPLQHLPGDHLQTILQPEHLQDTHYILRALSTFLSASFSPSLPVFLILSSSCSFSSLRFIILINSPVSQSVGHCPILSGLLGVFNFSACACVCVCSAGTFFVVSRVSPFKKNSNQTMFLSSSVFIPLSSPLSRGLTHLFVLLLPWDMCLFPIFYPLFHALPFSCLSSCCMSCF